MSNRKWPATTALAAMLVLVASGVAEARERHRDVSARPYTRTTQTQRTDNGYTRHDSIVNAKGKSATRDVTVSNDRETRTRTRNADYVGPNGKARSVDTVTQKTDNGYSREVTETRANGEVRTRSVDASCDPSSKSCTKTVVNNGGGAPAP